MPLARSLALTALATLAGCGGQTGNTGQTAPAGGSTGGSSAGAAGSSASAGSGAASGSSSTALGGTGGATSTAPWKTCAKPGDCLLAPNGCCGYPCGVVKASDVEAVDYLDLAAQAKATCPTPEQCPPKCAPFTNADLIAVCREKLCSVIEVSKDSLSTCASDTDCVIHLDQCCNCVIGIAEHYVALNGASVSAYEAQVCGPNVGGCNAGCASVLPQSLSAKCGADGHCRVAQW